MVQLGIYASPDVAGRFLKAEATADLTKEQVINIYNGPDLKPSYSFGVMVNINTTKWLDIETGVKYSNMGTQVVTKGPFKSGGQWNPATSSFDPVLAPEFEGVKKIIHRYDMHYIGVPLYMMFKAGKGKVKFSGGLGVTPQILLAISNNFVKVYGAKRDNNVRYEEPENYRRFNISPYVSAGIDAQLSKLLMLRVQPYFTCNTIPAFKAPTDFYYFSAGLGTTLYFGL